MLKVWASPQTPKIRISELSENSSFYPRLCGTPGYSSLRTTHLKVFLLNAIDKHLDSKKKKQKNGRPFSSMLEDLLYINANNEIKFFFQEFLHSPLHSCKRASSRSKARAAQNSTSLTYHISVTINQFTASFIPYKQFYKLTPMSLKLALHCCSYFFSNLPNSLL